MEAKEEKKEELKTKPTKIFRERPREDIIRVQERVKKDPGYQPCFKETERKSENITNQEVSC